MKVRPARRESVPCRRRRAKRCGLLAGAALGALAGSGPAHAQAINATPTTVSGTVAYSRFGPPTPGSERITVNSPTAIIHWQPGAPITNPYSFLPAGNVVRFDSDGANFTVLNRVLINVPIRLDGNVLSRLGTAAGAPAGGTVLFSSPGGIIVGSSARFDVGNLVLTSLNVIESSPGSFVTAAGGFDLGGAFGGLFQEKAAVVVEPGALINAPSEGSYVALVAPQVIQGGSVRVNGSVGYIGADAVQFSVNQGLFDIVVNTGSNNVNPIVHTGSTGGPSTTGAPGDGHQIVAAAVARNQAITLLLQGAIGYDAAAVAGIDNGVVVLSAGHNVSGGTINPAPVPGPLASLSITDAAFSSEAVGRATGTIKAVATAADPVTFADDLRLTAAGALSMTGSNIPVGGNLGLSGATVDIDSVTAGGTIDTTSAGSTRIDNSGSGVTTFVTSAGAATLGTIDAGANIRVAADSITLADGDAADDILLNATGNATVGSARAGDDFQATAGGAFAAGSIVASGLGDDTEDVSTPQEGFNILIQAGTDLRVDNATAPDRLELTSTAGSVLSDGTIDVGGDIAIASVGDTRLTNVTSAGAIAIHADGIVTAASLVAGGDVLVDPISIAIGSITSGGDITLDASTFIDVGTAVADDDFVAGAGSTFTSNSVTARGVRDSEGGSGGLAGGNISIDSSGNLTLHNGNAADNIRLLPKAGSIFGNGTLTAGGNIDAQAPGGGIDINDGDAGGRIDLIADTGVDARDLDAGGTIAVDTNGNATLASAVSGDDINILADGVVNIGGLNAFDNVLVDPVSVTIGSVVAGGDIALDATTFILVGSADAGDDFTATAGTFFTAGTVIARGIKDSEAGVGPLAGGNIVIDSNNDLRLDNGDAADDIRLTTRIDSIFSSTLLDAGSDIAANARGDIGINDANAGQLINLDAGLGIVAADLVAGGTITTNAGFATTIATAGSGNSILVTAGGAAGLGTLQATTDIAVDAAAITLASGTAGRDVSLDAANDIAVTASQAGDDFAATAGGAFTGGTVTTTGLGTDTEGGSGTFGGSTIVVDSTGDLRLDNGTSPTRIQLASAAGSVLSAGTLRSGLVTANAALDMLLHDVFSVGALTLSTVNGDISGNLFDSDADIALNASDAVTLAQADSGGTISVVAGGPATLGTFVAVGDIAATASAINFTSATAGRDVTLGATGNIVLASARAGDDVVANAGGTFTGGTVTVTGAGADSEAGAGALAGRNIVVRSTGDLRLDTGTSPGLIDLASAGGSLLSSGTLTANRLLASAPRNYALNNVAVVQPLSLVTANGTIGGNTFTSGGDITLNASGAVTVATADSGGRLLVDSGATASLGTARAAGDVDVGGAQVLLASATAGRDVLVDSTGAIDVGTATATRNFVANGGAGGEFTNLTAASIAIGLAGTARFDGSVAAPAIAVTSADIDIAAGSFGNAATQNVALAARPTGLQTVLGGAVQGAGYTLTDAEADRIRAVTLTVQAAANGTAANRAPDVLVRDLSLAGQAVGTLQVTTPGILQVEGGLLLSAVQPGGGIGLTATERLQVLNPTGSIRVRDSAGLTDGSLRLASNNIWSASQSLLDQLTADSNFAGRDAALLANGGAVQPRGYIEGGTVVLSARDSLFVQNSGTLASFAGVTVRQNTLRLVPTGTAPLRVFAFGNRINPDGTFVTNMAFFNEVIYQGRGGPVGYTDDAQFNLCFINTGVCRVPTPDNPLPGGPDIIEQPVDSSFTVQIPGASDDLVDTSFADEPLIEEPVTSGGDSILWDCDNDDDGDCDEDDYDG